MRLTIGVLLLWTTTTAISLGLASSLQRTRDATYDSYFYSHSYRRMLWAQDLLWFLAAPAYGAALAAAAAAAYRAAKQLGGFPTQPGHWIAVMLGIATLGFFAAMAPSSDWPTQRLVATAVTVVLAVVSCLAATATRSPRRWRAALLVNAGGLCALVAVVVAVRASGLDATMPAMWLFVALPALAIGVAVLVAGVAAISDLVRPPRQDLFHWVGVVSLAVLVAHPVIAAGLYWYR